ncbi:MAG: 2Fe-2S iron-sulfur cluster-binding protein [Bacteroidia bacterium]
MAKITFITPDNERITLESTSGSVMQLAVDNDIKGIDGNCGGVCSCATCHVHVAEEYMDKVGQAGDIEKDMLEFENDADQFSRLSCQIEITEAIDGIVLTVAKN